jgi:hypothetical protein
MTVGQKLLEYMLEKHGNMKILPNTKRILISLLNKF